METIRIFFPAVFCAFLSLMMVFRPGGLSGSGLSIYLLNLPMCFLFTGFVMTRMHREVKALRQRLAVLEASGAGQGMGATLPVQIRATER